MNWTFWLELSVGGERLNHPLEVPRSVLNPIALDLKYEGLGKGIVTLQEWSRVKTVLAPVYEPGESDQAPQVVAIEARLEVGSRRYAKQYAVSEFQGLRLVLATEITRRHAIQDLKPDDVVTARLRATQIPNRPSLDDLHWDPAVVPPPLRGFVAHNEGPDLALLVDRSAIESMKAELTARPDIEQGGLLLGRVVRCRQRVVTSIERYLPANAEDCSEVKLRFSVDELITMMGQVPREDALSIVGWHHTHTKSYPNLTLSEVDLVSHHRVFRAPWNVASLALCVDEFRLCWFGWRGGNVQAIDPDRVRPPVLQRD